MEINIDFKKIFDDTYCIEKNKEVLNSLDREDLYENLRSIALKYIKPYDYECYQEFMKLIASESYYKEIERNDVYLVKDIYFWIKFAKNPL